MCLVREMGFLQVYAHLHLRPRQQGSTLHFLCRLTTLGVTCSHSSSLLDLKPS